MFFFYSNYSFSWQFYLLCSYVTSSNLSVCLGEIHSSLSLDLFLKFISIGELLQYCDGFCHTLAWTGHRYTGVPSLLNAPPTSLPTSSLQVVRALALGSLHHTSTSHWPSISHMAMYMFQCYFLKSSHLLPRLCPKVYSLCLCFLCCPAWRMVGTIFLDSIYMR